jgi:hypothetical protein
VEKIPQKSFLGGLKPLSEFNLAALFHSVKKMSEKTDMADEKIGKDS